MTIRATHRRRKVSAAHDRNRNTAGNNRLGQLSAALHGDDFGFKAVFF